MLKIIDKDTFKGLADLRVITNVEVGSTSGTCIKALQEHVDVFSVVSNTKLKHFYTQQH